MKFIVNGHEFERTRERFNFGDGCIMDMPSHYAIDGKTVSEEVYYRAMAIEMRLEQARWERERRHDDH